MDHEQEIPITEALRRHEGALLALPNVVGVAESEQAGGPAIQVLVTHRLADAAIPSELSGYPVVVREVGELQAES